MLLCVCARAWLCVLCMCVCVRACLRACVSVCGCKLDSSLVWQCAVRGYFRVWRCVYLLVWLYL